MTPSHVADITSAFHDPSDGAAMKSRDLILSLLALTPDPFSRHQFHPGHITCSAMVLHPDGERILIVHHRRLDRWLLPGGHVESTDARIWDTSRREAVEETGAVLVPAAAPPLSSLDVHDIPSNGSEPYHLHHDLQFSFEAASAETRLSHESRAIAWCSPAEFDRYSIPDNVRLAYARRTRRYN